MKSVTGFPFADSVCDGSLSLFMAGLPVESRRRIFARHAFLTPIAPCIESDNGYHSPYETFDGAAPGHS